MKNIDFICPINPTGYGQHGLNLALELIKLREGVRLFPIGDVQCTPKQLELLKPHIAKKDVDKKNIVVKLWHETDIEDKIKGSPFIYYPVFEVSEFNKEQRDKFSLVDNYFVPSVWAKNIIVALNKDAKVSVVPEGVADDINYIVSPSPVFALPTYINIGKHEIRKGTYDLLKAASYLNSKLNIIIHCPNPFKPDLESHLIKKNFKNKISIPGVTGPIELLWYVYGLVNIYISNNFLTRENYLRLISYADFGVFPYRAEGWNIPLAEVLASGLPTACTQASGPTEYLTAYNHLSITTELSTIDKSEGYYTNTVNSAAWEVARPENIATAMVGLPSKKEMIKSNLSSFKQEWSWRNAALEFVEACKQYE